MNKYFTIKRTTNIKHSLVFTIMSQTGPKHAHGNTVQMIVVWGETRLLIMIELADIQPIHYECCICMMDTQLLRRKKVNHCL